MSDKNVEKQGIQEAFLAHARQQRSYWDGVIQAIETGKAVSPAGSAGPAASASKSPEASSGVIRSDEFHNLSVPKAILRYLEIAGRPARSTEEIAAGIEKGGTGTTAKLIYVSLMRLRDRKAVDKVGTKWGLADWYEKPPSSGSGTSEKTQ